MNGISVFPIQRGVNPDDTLSAILFNCILNIAFDAFDIRRASLLDEGILVAHGLARLTNTRYVDDVLLYAKSSEELVSMMKSHMISL